MSGDLVLFDMRTLHAGTANLPDGGSTRYFLCVTFRNTKACGLGVRAEDLGHLPCIRQRFKETLTLGDVRRELAKERPFAEIGNGLPVPVPAAQ